MATVESKDAYCPDCGDKGRTLHSITTLHALLVDSARSRLGDHNSLRFCRNGECSTVYFAEHVGSFSVTDILVPVFQKSSDPNRAVCYCFDHTVASINAEIQQTGQSTVVDSIADKCRAGMDRCAERNPQGSCCLGNVRHIVNSARRDMKVAQTVDPEKEHTCCESTPTRYDATKPTE